MREILNPAVPDGRVSFLAEAQQNNKQVTMQATKKKRKCYPSNLCNTHIR